MGSSVEQRILATLQDGLPRTRTPYHDLARTVGISTEELLRVLDQWKQQGVIRRLGAIVNHFQVGLGEGAMVVWAVEPGRVQEIGTLFAGFERVSHAYEREMVPGWQYNVYTMVHGATLETVRQIVGQMSEATGISDYVVLATRKELKKVAPRYVG
jgi:DNA-binding Lrp family transcriptional regulator